MDWYIWATNRARNPNACQYYRINVPLQQLEKLQYAYGYEDKGERGDDDLRAMLTSDVCIFYSLMGETVLYQLQTIKNMKSGIRIDGKRQFPPIVIYDVDDNSDYVHPMNPTFSYLGVRSYPDEKFLEPGNIIEWENPDGEREILWEDKITKDGLILFDIERNLKELKIRHEIVRTCHGATVTTPPLANYFREVSGQKNVYVFPNTIIPGHYEQFDVVRTDHNVRILWQGSQSHYVDWYPMRDALKTVNDKYPNITWVIYGTKFSWIHDIIPEDKIEYHSWSPYQSYKLRRGLLNIDINLCVLSDNGFNRCKSAIKWYEGSIWDKPEATIAANVAPYFEIQDGKTGLLYNSLDEFVEKMGTLIENAELRKRLGENARKWVLNNRTPEKTIPGLFEFYKELKDAQKRELAPMVKIGTNTEFRKLTARKQQEKECLPVQEM